MKRKLIKRSTQRYNYIFSLGNFYVRIIYRQRESLRVSKLTRKYYQVLDYENVCMLGRLISVPVVTKAKCKKSRITNNVYSYRIFTSIENFNAESGLNYSLSDIKPID